MPYAPMHSAPLGTAADVEAMKVKLAKRIKPQVSVEVLNVGPTPKAEEAPPPELTWSKLTGDSILASNGMVILRTPDNFIVFDRQTTKEHTAQPVADFKIAQDAKDYCARYKPK